MWGDCGWVGVCGVCGYGVDVKRHANLPQLLPHQLLQAPPIPLLRQGAVPSEPLRYSPGQSCQGKPLSGGSHVQPVEPRLLLEPHQLLVCKLPSPGQ